jgi:hypothetical protein
VNAAPGPAGDWIVGLVAKRTYQIEYGRFRLSPEQVPLVERPRPGALPAMLDHDTDLIVNRRLTDVIIRGHAHALGRRQTTLEVQLSIDRWVRTTRVFGDRTVEWNDFGPPRFTPPAEIEKVPLDWAFAYGGVDETARKKYGDPVEEAARKAGAPYLPAFGMFAYPRNPMGRGYVTEPSKESMDGLPLPNLELPENLLTPATLAIGDFRYWPRAPYPAGFNWLPYAFFPRSIQAGFLIRPYHGDQIAPRQFPEVKLTALTDGEIEQAARPGHGSIGFVQGAPVTMRLPEVPTGATIGLTNAHPDTPAWRFRFDANPPRMYLRAAGAKAVELVPHVRTLMLLPDENRLCVLWVGEHHRQPPPGPAELAKTEHAVVWRD